MDALVERVKRMTPCNADVTGADRRERMVALDRLNKDLGRRYSVKRCSLESFQVYAKGQREALDSLCGVAEDWPDRLNRGEGLIFLGSVGAGKDHLCAAMLGVAVAKHGFRCGWIGGQELFGRFRDQIDKAGPEREQTKELVEPDVLAISDPIPAAGDLTRWSLDQLYRLIDRRYRDMKSTWITINAASPEEADERLSAQVFDRLREGACIIRCFWPSFRERNK